MFDPQKYSVSTVSNLEFSFFEPSVRALPVANNDSNGK